jgi:hypothetical protein
VLKPVVPCLRLHNSSWSSYDQQGVMVPSTRHTRPLTSSMASSTVGTNSARTAFTNGTSVDTILDTVDCEVFLRSPRNSWETFCRTYMQAISTARYSSHDFGRPVFLFHGSVNAP